MPLELDKRLRGYRLLPLEWSQEMAYVVGLLATDGCLSSDRRHIIFTSGDRQLVETYLGCLGRPIRYSTRRSRTGRAEHYAQFSDVAFYDWLLSIGLRPRKSLTLGPIDVPDAYLASLARGLLDGDGTISVFTHAPTRARYPDYLYEPLWVLFLSASRLHIEWLRARLREAFGLDGRFETVARKDRHELYRLKFGKRASILLLKRLYEDPAAPRLIRKWRSWKGFAGRNRCAEGGS